MKFRIAPCLFVLLFFLTACLGTTSNLSSYRAKDLSPRPLKTIAVMPMAVVLASTSKTSGSFFSPIYIKSEIPMSPGEYLPAQAAWVEQMDTWFPDSKIILPSEIEAAMKDSPAPTYEEAIIRVPEAVGAEGVITIELRELLLEGGGYEGGAGGQGTASVTLYDSKGSVLWSVSGQVKLKSGGNFSAAPTFAEFVRGVIDEFHPEVQRLKRQ